MKTAGKKTAAKKSAVKVEVPFGQWVKEVARARGDIGGLVEKLREEKGLTVKTPLKTAAEKFGPKYLDFPKLAARYSLYLRRGSQSKKAA